MRLDLGQVATPSLGGEATFMPIKVALQAVVLSDFLIRPFFGFIVEQQIALFDSIRKLSTRRFTESFVLEWSLFVEVSFVQAITKDLFEEVRVFDRFIKKSFKCPLP